MTNQNRTDIILIVDRSGSMQNIAGDTEGAINHLIEEYRLVKQDVRITLVDFDTEIKYHSFMDPVSKTVNYKLFPRGYTALYDAVGTTMNRVGDHYSSLSEQNRPGKVLVIIATDGQENASTEFNRDRIRSMIEHQNQRYNWQFMYVGANQDAYAEAGRIGIQPQCTMNYVATSGGVRSAYSSIVRRSVSYTNSGLAEDLNFTDEDKQAQEEASENSK